MKTIIKVLCAYSSDDHWYGNEAGQFNVVLTSGENVVTLHYKLPEGEVVWGMDFPEVMKIIKSIKNGNTVKKDCDNCTNRFFCWTIR